VVEDPRGAIVEVMARLGRETQLHIDERYRHFRITDAVTIVVSLLLLVLAVFNVYFVAVLYQDLEVTINNMDSMYQRLKNVDADMAVITDRFGGFDRHIQHMTPIGDHMAALARVMPGMRRNMDAMAKDMPTIEQQMGLVVPAMVGIEQRMNQMGAGVAIMRQNTVQMAAPMGLMNNFMP